jgi:hypothetical protein
MGNRPYRRVTVTGDDLEQVIRPTLMATDRLAVQIGADSTT